MTITGRNLSAGLTINDNVVNFFTIFLAVIGFVFLTAKTISFARLVFSLFICPALPVRTDGFFLSLTHL